jgi:hypothetical protein
MTQTVANNGEVSNSYLLCATSTHAQLVGDTSEVDLRLGLSVLEASGEEDFFGSFRSHCESWALAMTEWVCSG